MKRLSYGARSIITDDRASNVVLQYAQLLGSHGKFDVVSIPAVDDAGITMIVDVLIGPSSHLMAEPYSGGTLAVDEFLTDLRARTDGLAVSDYAPYQADALD